MSVCPRASVSSSGNWVDGPHLPGLFRTNPGQGELPKAGPVFIYPRPTQLLGGAVPVPQGQLSKQNPPQPWTQDLQDAQGMQPESSLPPAILGLAPDLPARAPLGLWAGHSHPASPPYALPVRQLILNSWRADGSSSVHTARSKVGLTCFPYSPVGRAEGRRRAG